MTPPPTLPPARSRPANAVLGVRFESADIGDGLAEVMAYRTAEVIEPDSSTGVTR